MSGHILLAAVLVILLIQDVRADDGDDYDVNTEVTVSGVVTEAGEVMRGPYVFTMAAADKTYKVVTGPWWYLNQIGFAVRVGMKVEVTGSKYYGIKGELYIAAFSITGPVESKTYRFRDETTQRPLWHGHGGGGQRR